MQLIAEGAVLLTATRTLVGSRPLVLAPARRGMIDHGDPDPPPRIPRDEPLPDELHRALVPYRWLATASVTAAVGAAATAGAAIALL